MYLLIKIYSNAYSSVWHLGMPVVGWVLAFMGAYGLLPIGFQFVMVYLLFASITIFDFYGFMYRSLSNFIAPYIDKEMDRKQKIKMSIALYFYTPFHFVVQALPRLYAPFKYYQSPDKPQIWYKTERTEEVSKIERTPALRVAEVMA